MASKTLILNLGDPERGDAAFPPSNLARLEIDGEVPGDIRAITIEIDASQGKPAHFHIERTRVIDGQEWDASEAHLILNTSLIIEYREDI